MTISEGDRLPDASLLRKTGDGQPEPVQLGALLEGRKVVIFATPAAFSGTCQNAHVPSFIRTKPAFEAKGVDDVLCITVNDPYVVSAWAEVTGADAAGLIMLADPASTFTTAIGMNFDYPPHGMLARSKRYAMLVDDGVVSVLSLEDNPGQCSISSGEELLDKI